MKTFLKKTVCMVCAFACLALVGCGGGDKDNDDGGDAFADFKGDLSAFKSGNYRVATAAEIEGYPLTERKIITDIFGSESGGAYVYAEEMGNSFGKETISETMYYTKAEGRVGQMQKEEVGYDDGEVGTFYTYADNEGSYYHSKYENGDETKFKETGENNSADSVVSRKFTFMAMGFSAEESMLSMFIDERAESMRYVSGTKDTEYFIDDSDATCVKVKMVITWTDYKVRMDGADMDRFDPTEDAYAEVGSTVNATDVLIAVFDENGVCQGALRQVEGDYLASLLNGETREVNFTGVAAFVKWNGQITAPTDLDVYEEAA